MSSTKLEVGDGSLFVSAHDDVKMRFYRAAILANYPGQTRSGMKLAAWMIECMDWKTGVVVRNTSIHRLMAMTKLSRSRVDDGLKELCAAGLINRTYVGGGRKGAIKVADRVVELQVGQNVSELWPEEKPAPIWGKATPKPDCPDLGQATCPDLGQDLPRSGASYPIPVYPAEIPAAGSSNPIEGSTTERPLTPPTPINSLRGKLKTERPPLPPVAHATVKSQVAGATVDRRVAGTPEHYGYGNEIAGLEGRTTEVVDRLAKIEGGIILDKTPLWIAVRDAVRQTSPARVQAAILDLEAKTAAKKLTGRPARLLASWARRADESEARERIDAASRPKPFRLMDHISGGHRR